MQIRVRVTRNYGIDFHSLESSSKVGYGFSIVCVYILQMKMSFMLLQLIKMMYYIYYVSV
jgi:hypothetical protein